MARREEYDSNHCLEWWLGANKTLNASQHSLTSCVETEGAVVRSFQAQPLSLSELLRLPILIPLSEHYSS